MSRDVGTRRRLMLEATDLKKSFGSVEAVRGLSFSVNSGEVVGFLGPNGAGKTTTFRMLAGTIGPSAGTIKIQSRDLKTDPIGAKRLIGYMPENAPLYPELTVREYLSYRAALKNLPRKKRKKSLEAAAEKAGAQSVIGTRIAHLSKGFRQRVALADALLASPPVLLLDEPTAGLDPNQVLDVRRLIRSLASDHAIMLSTHILSEVEATCSRALVIHQGKIVGAGTLDELRQSRAPNQALIVVRATLDLLKKCLQPLNIEDAPIEFTKLREQSSGTALSSATLPIQEEGELSEAIRLCVQSNLDVVKATTVGAALDDAFAHLTEAAE